MAVLTTSRLGLPYPDGNDRLRDGDNRIGDLATKLDNLDAVGIPFAMAAGMATVAVGGAVEFASVAVTFPATRFSQAPIVVAHVGGSARYIKAVIGGLSTAGMTVVGVEKSDLQGSNMPADTYFVYWHAIQMLPGAGPG